MKWYQSVLSFAAAINMIAFPVVAQTQMTDAEKQKLSQDSQIADKYNYRMAMEHGKAVFYDKTTGRPAAEVPYGEESRLRKFSPKNLNEMLKTEMARVNTSSKAAFAHSLKALPTESVIFFFAMGAVVAGQLLANYSQNPLAMKQHIDHQMSPVGVFGFFTFMVSQGVTANMLSMYIKNPKFHHMIPYMGMAVGAFVQTYLTSVASDPNVMACAKTMIGKSITEKDLEKGADKNPCEKAYEYLVINKKIWEFAPGIASMLISAGMAGVGQAALTKAVLRITGVDLAVYLVPGRMQLQGIRLLLVKGMQITAFVAIDVWINRTIMNTWKNFFDGADFYEMNTRLNMQVNALKSSQWNSSEKDAEKELKLIRQKMAEWRMMNLSEVYEAHQSWSENINRLMSMYNSSHSFYDTFINEVRNSKYNLSHVKGLDIPYPFIGVKAKDLADGKEDLYFTAPKFVEPLQIDTIAEAVDFVDNMKTKFPQSSAIYPYELKQIKAIRDLLAQESIGKKAEGLLEFNKAQQMAFQSTATSRSFVQFLYAIRGILGNPEPMMEPGRGFLANYEIAPSTAETLKNTAYYRKVGMFLTPKATDYLLMQMICGPDAEANQQVIKNSTGFLSVFLPPQIRTASKEFETECNTIGSKGLAGSAIYSWPMKKNGKSYNGMLSYLKENIRPQVLGDAKESSFTNWWKSTTDSQMKLAFDDFGAQYSVIVGKLITGLHKVDRNPFNRGPIANGAFDSAIQEQKIYLSVLEELLKPTSIFNVKFESTLVQKSRTTETQEVERQFEILRQLLSRVKVIKYQKEARIESDIENYQLEEQLEGIQTALKNISDKLGVGDDNSQAIVKLNEKQRNLAVTALENLQALGTEMMMYGSIANAVTWDKIRNLKRIDMEQQQFNNDVQAKLFQMRGLVPGAR
ncbi:hypothetical protein D3C87_111770 [compost metagenome]